MPTIGIEIKKHRTRRRLSQTALAALLKVPRNTVSRWERGLEVPELYEIELIADILEIDANKLLVERLPPPVPPPELTIADMFGSLSADGKILVANVIRDVYRSEHMK